MALSMLDLIPHSLPDRMFLLSMALVASLLLGGPRWLYQFFLLDRPGQWITHLLGALEHKLNRAHRPAATRRFRGLLLVLLALATCLLSGVAVSHLSVQGTGYALFELLILILLLPLRRNFEQVTALRQAVAAHDIAQAHAAMKVLARRDAAGADLHTAARTGIEVLAIRFSSQIVSTVCWYLLLGLPGALAGAVLLGMDDLFGQKQAEDRAFGAAAVTLNALWQLIPARLAALLLWAASPFTPSNHPAKATAALISGSSRLPLFVAAGALGITLGGPRTYHGVTIPGGWAEYGPARIGAPEILRMQWLYGVACGILLLVIASANLLF